MITRVPFLRSLPLPLVTGLIAVLMVACNQRGSPAVAAGGAGASQARYHCPMHPTYVSDRAGDCPICGMRLVPIKGEQAASKAAAPAADEKAAHILPGQFDCPMHPEVVQDAPGKCPKCGMNLVEKQAAPVGHERHAMHTEAGVSVPGRIAISLSPDKRQLIGLTLSKVEKRNLTRTVRTVAVVEHDETRYARIAPRFAGWVRKLHVNFTGAPVERNQPLFTVYSPDLYSAENDYLIAWRRARQRQEAALADSADSALSLLESARLRLELFEIGEEEIKALEARGAPSAELPFRAPFSGHVLAKNAVEGKAFMAGETLYEIADLSHLWLRAYVYEFDLPLVSTGLAATLNFPYLGNRSFPAQVTFIYPHIEPETRRGQIRLELDNPDHLVRPDMWANVEIQLPAGEKLTVPASALIDTGQRYVAFVAGEQDHLEPREVKTAARTDDYYEVLSGLQEGEQVVTRALFLVDSESQLKAAIAGMGAAEGHQH